MLASTASAASMKPSIVVAIAAIEPPKLSVEAMSGNIGYTSKCRSVVAAVTPTIIGGKKGFKELPVDAIVAAECGHVDDHRPLQDPHTHQRQLDSVQRVQPVKHLSTEP